MSESVVEDAFEAYLAGVAERSDALRREATRALAIAANQARELGWSQRRTASVLGRSQPEVLRLLRLAEDPPALSGFPHDVPRSMLPVVLGEHRDAIVKAASRHGASNVRVFGSVARGEDGPTSDVDLLVDLQPGTGLFALGELEVELEAILGRGIDVVPASSLRGTVRATVQSIPL